MVESSTIEIRQLQNSDVAAALRLKELAGWNQTERGWQRLLRLEPQGCFCATLEDRVVGTSTTITYAADLAWIGMVLVDPEYRKRGIGTRLMQAALDYLRHIGVATVKLDATPHGRPLYENLGFTFESRVERWRGNARAAGPSDCTPLSRDALMDVLALDRDAFSADRSKLVEILMADACVTPIMSIASDGSLSGYALARRGSNATYVGPLIAKGPSNAEQLLDGLLERLSGQEVYVDLNMEFDAGEQILASRGFVKQRDLDRMFYGKNTEATSKLVFAIAGPELG